MFVANKCVAIAFVLLGRGCARCGRVVSVVGGLSPGARTRSADGHAGEPETGIRAGGPCGGQRRPGQGAGGAEGRATAHHRRVGAGWISWAASRSGLHSRPRSRGVRGRRSLLTVAARTLPKWVRAAGVHGPGSRGPDPVGAAPGTPPTRRPAGPGDRARPPDAPPGGTASNRQTAGHACARATPRTEAAPWPPGKPRSQTAPAPKLSREEPRPLTAATPEVHPRGAEAADAGHPRKSPARSRGRGRHSPEAGPTGRTVGPTSGGHRRHPSRGRPPEGCYQRPSTCSLMRRS